MEARTFRVGDRVVAYISRLSTGYRWFNDNLGEVCPRGTSLYYIKSPSLKSSEVSFLIKDSCTSTPMEGMVLMLGLVAVGKYVEVRSNIWKAIYK